MVLFVMTQYCICQYVSLKPKEYFNFTVALFSLPENKNLLQNAKLELKKSKRKDYYKILGVHKTASEDEIKRAYKKRALIHHPGEWLSAPISLLGF